MDHHTQAYCQRCAEMRLFSRPSGRVVPHALYLLLLVLLSCGAIGVGGLGPTPWWLVVLAFGLIWFIHWQLTVLFAEPFRCTQCGQAEGDTLELR